MAAVATDTLQGDLTSDPAVTVPENENGGESWRFVGDFMDLSRFHCQRLYSKDGEREDLALFYNRGKFYAMGAWCGHMGGPLYEGDIEDYNNRPHVMCPWHSYMFDLENGKNDLGMEQNVHKVKVENRKVYVYYSSDLSSTPNIKKQ